MGLAGFTAMVGSLSWFSSPLSALGIMFTTSTPAAGARLADRERRAGARRAGRLSRRAAAVFARAALVFRLAAMSVSLLSDGPRLGRTLPGKAQQSLSEGEREGSSAGASRTRLEDSPDASGFAIRLEVHRRQCGVDALRRLDLRRPRRHRTRGAPDARRTGCDLRLVQHEEPLLAGLKLRGLVPSDV